MKTFLWVLLLASLVVMLVGLVSKICACPFFHFAPVTWWRGAMALAVYTLVLAKLTDKKV